MDKTKIHYNKSFIRTKIINGHPYNYQITPYWDPVAKKQHQKCKYIGKAETVSKEKLNLIQDKNQIKSILESNQATGAIILLLLQPTDPEELLLLLQKHDLLHKCLLLVSKK